MLGNCFSLIRFNEIDHQELGKRLKLFGDMFSKEEIINMYSEPMNNDCYRYDEESICFEFELSNDSIERGRFVLGKMNIIFFSVSKSLRLNAIKLTVPDERARGLEDITKSVTSVSVGESCFSGVLHQTTIACRNHNNELYIELKGDDIIIEPHIEHCIYIECVDIDIFNLYQLASISSPIYLKLLSVNMLVLLRQCILESVNKST